MTTALLLSYRPFFDPLPVGSGLAWTLALFLPLILLVSVAYKAIKLQNLAHVPPQAARLAVQIVLFMGGAALLLALITR